jgi:YegS/Rv2252/BmrU family lipid kinase
VAHPAPVTIIINPISGAAGKNRGHARAQIARAAVDEARVDARIVVTEAAGHANALAREAAASGARAVIAWGGDGTINEVASALARGPVPLGIVPAGSGNGLARDLRIDARPARAIAAALTAEPHPIDVGQIEERLFVNMAGAGVDAHIARRFNRADNTRRGFLGYVRVTMDVLRRYVPAVYRITCGGSTFETRALLVTVANSSQFGNGARIAPAARLDDGLLDLVVVGDRSAFNTLCQMPRLFTGRAERIPGCRFERIREATIEADQPMTFHVDGEPCQGGTRLRARVHPRALLVLA